MTNIWDEIPASSDGDFVSFNVAGDSVSGVIQSISVKVWDDGNVCPQLEITCDDGETRTLTAGQTKLKAALRDQRPNVGDHIKATLTSIEKRAGNRTLKHFDLTVTPAKSGPGISTTPAATTAAAENPQAAALRAAGLTEDQIAAALSQ